MHGPTFEPRETTRRKKNEKPPSKMKGCSRVNKPTLSLSFPFWFSYHNTKLPFHPFCFKQSGPSPSLISYYPKKKTKLNCSLSSSFRPYSKPTTLFYPCSLSNPKVTKPTLKLFSSLFFGSDQKPPFLSASLHFVG